MTRQEAKIESQNSDFKCFQRELEAKHDSPLSWDQVTLNAIRGDSVDDRQYWHMDIISKPNQQLVTHHKLGATPSCSN